MEYSPEEQVKHFEPFAEFVPAGHFEPDFTYDFTSFPEYVPTLHFSHCESP